MKYSGVVIINKMLCPCKRSRSEMKDQGHSGGNKFCSNSGISRLQLQFEFTNGYKIIYKAWSGKEEVPNCFSRSSIKFQGDTSHKISNLISISTFQDDISSLNLQMASKYFTMLRWVWKRCPLVFQSHISSFKVTQATNLPIWLKFWLSRSLGGSQLSNPSDWPC